MPRVLKPVDRAAQKKAAEVFIDFQYKAFALTFDALAKALAFYFLLLGASFGIVFQSKPGEKVLTAVLAFSVLLTLISGFAFAVGVKGLLGSIRRLGASMVTLDAKAFQTQKLDEYFLRTRKFILLVAALCELVLVLITGFSAAVLVARRLDSRSASTTVAAPQNLQAPTAPAPPVVGSAATAAASSASTSSKAGP